MSLYLRNSFAYLLQNKAAFLKHKDFVPLSSYNYPSYTTISLHKNQVNSSKHHKAYLESVFFNSAMPWKVLLFHETGGRKNKTAEGKEV